MARLPRNIEMLIEAGGEVVLGKLPLFDCVAIATDDAGGCLATLVRRDGETLARLITRLDRAVHLGRGDDRFIDEVNHGPSAHL